MWERLVRGADALVRGVIYVSCLICGASLAVLAAWSVLLFCYRLGQWLWVHLLGFDWTGQ